MHHAIGAQCQVQAMARFGQVANIGALPDAAGVVERRRSDSFGVRVVGIIECRKTQRSARVHECLLVSVPLVLFPPSALDRAFSAVKVASVVQISFDTPQVR